MGRLFENRSVILDISDHEWFFFSVILGVVCFVHCHFCTRSHFSGNACEYWSFLYLGLQISIHLLILELYHSYAESDCGSPSNHGRSYGHLEKKSYYIYSQTLYAELVCVSHLTQWLFPWHITLFTFIYIPLIRIYRALLSLFWWAICPVLAVTDSIRR